MAVPHRHTPRAAPSRPCQPVALAAIAYLSGSLSPSVDFGTAAVLTLITVLTMLGGFMARPSAVPVSHSVGLGCAPVTAPDCCGNRRGLRAAIAAYGADDAWLLTMLHKHERSAGETPPPPTGVELAAQTTPPGPAQLPDEFRGRRALMRHPQGAPAAAQPGLRAAGKQGDPQSPKLHSNPLVTPRRQPHLLAPTRRRSCGPSCAST